MVAPTRELALQIFDVLRAVGKHHTFSAGLLVGGKKEFNDEQQRVGSMSVLVATPGRLLQHLEQTPGFETGGLQVSHRAPRGAVSLGPGSGPCPPPPPSKNNTHAISSAPFSGAALGVHPQWNAPDHTHDHTGTRT